MSEKEAKKLGNDDQSCLIFSEKKKWIKTNNNNNKILARMTMEVWHNS